MKDKTSLLSMRQVPKKLSGKEMLPDCPYCGYDYRGVMVIVALLFFALVSVSYRGSLGGIKPSPASFLGPEGVRR